MTLRTYTNPVYPRYFADPYVWRAGNQYYAIGTGASEAEGAVGSSSAATIFPLLTSDDLVKWREAGRALVRPDASLGDTFWAPEVVCHDDRWFLYYSVGFDDRNHHIRVATSAQPQGPYRDRAALTSPRECAFAIDPHAFRDTDGQWYLFHARDFLEASSEGRAGTALVAQRLRGMTQLEGELVIVARAQCDWQRFAAQRAMYGKTFDWHTLEGPFVVKRNDRYYCIYSGGCWQNDTYGVDYVVADSPLGPYRYEWGDDERRPRILQTVPGKVLGPGHCSVIRRNESYWLVYHAWDAGMCERRMCIDRLQFTPTGPQCAGPSFTEQVIHD